MQSNIRRFVTEWKQGREPQIEDYVTGTGASRTALLVELVGEDLKYRLKVGRDHEVELYLKRYPELGDEEAAGLIVRDYELRRRCGRTVVVTDYLDRFPRLKRILTRRFSSIQPPEADRPTTNTESLLPVSDQWATMTQRRATSGLSVPDVGSRSQFEAKFEWIEKLGEGGMGEVWRVRHRDLNEDRAVKFILPRHAHLDETRERLKREAQAMARVDHPHAVTVHDVCMDGVPYIEMEYLRGQPLNKILKPKVPLPLEQTAQILKQLCDVLQSAHDCRIIHRDLKPANLMLIDTGSPNEIFLKVMDFGVAKFLEPACEITEPGLPLGTPVYMSPEQVESPASVDARSDLYSVGMILYELLTGCRPFTSFGFRLYQEIAHTPAPPFRERNPNAQVDPAIEKLVLRCLEKDRTRRPASASELAQEFLRLAAPEIGDHRETVFENRAVDRRWILGAIAGLGLGGVALAWWLWPVPGPVSVPPPSPSRLSIAGPAKLKIQAGDPRSIVISVSPDHLASTTKVRVRDPLPKGIDVYPHETTEGIQREFRLRADLDIVSPSCSLVFVATDGRMPPRELSVRLLIEPAPIAGLPEHWLRGEKSKLVKIGDKYYPDVIEHAEIPGVEDRVVVLLVKEQRAGSQSAFYIMRDKVWVQLFAAFARKKPEKVSGSQWNKNGDPRWPVLGVTGVEAQAFAEWLGGRRQGFLPTREQWDLAAGKNHPDRGAGAFPKGWDPNDLTGTMIAVGDLKEPRQVGTARLDLSPYGCRDVYGNGWEWTRLPDGAHPSSDVDLRAETYRALKPFDFEKARPDARGVETFDIPNPEIGFRVVIELEPMGSD